MSPDPEQLARFVRVEPPAELDAWVRSRLRAAVAERAPDGASAPVVRAAGLRSAAAPSRSPLPMSAPSTLAESSCGVSPERSEVVPARGVPARAPASVPLVERLALSVGAVACGIQASGLLVRLLCSVLTLGR